MNRNHVDAAGLSQCRVLGNLWNCDLPLLTPPSIAEVGSPVDLVLEQNTGHLIVDDLRRLNVVRALHQEVVVEAPILNG